VSALFHPEAEDRRRAMLRTAMGPSIAAALADPAVVEVMVNPDGGLRLDRLGKGRTDTGVRLEGTEGREDHPPGCVSWLPQADPDRLWPQHRFRGIQLLPELLQLRGGALVS
jgi:hypothetical protein